MSIINQALQKAQREQVRQRSEALPYLSTRPRRRTARRRWLVLSLSCGMVLGLAGMGARWLLPPPPHLTVLPALPPAAPTTFVKAALRDTPRQASVTLPADTGRPAPPVPAPEEAAVWQTPVPAPVLVLAVESASPPLPVPVPRVTPIPLSGNPVPPPAPEGEAPTASGGNTVAHSAMARGQLLVQRALEAHNSGDLKRASSLLEQAIKLDQTSKTVYHRLGNVYFQQKRFQQAVSMYHQALALDPDYAKAHNNLGSAYMQLAMYEPAIEALQRALRSEEVAGLAYYNLACVYARKGESVTAAQHLRQAIILEPQARVWARTDEDFAAVRSTSVVQQLLEP